MRTLSLHAVRLVGVVGAALLSMGTARTASAQTVPDCSTLNNVVYVAGSSAVKPFLGAVASNLVQLADPINVVYISLGSCAGVAPFTGATTTAVNGTPSTWLAAGTEQSGSCTLPIGGAVPDIGVSDVFASSCGSTLPSSAKDFFGPIQAMAFVTPKKSLQTSISAEAAYLTLGFGAAGETAWNDPNQVFIRTATSGTQQMIGTAIKVPAAKWKSGMTGTTSNALGSSGAVRDALNNVQATGTQTVADLSIGILASDVADTARATLKVLPYQHFDQTCGYLPDSTATARDKQNVRDGHYMIWGPLHMVTRVTNAGVPVNADAKKVIDILSGAEPADFLLPVMAKTGVVPDCAMRVTRDDEVGPLSSYMPPESCECAFVAEATGATPDGCKPCTSDTQCPSDKPACNYNFCEVR